MRVLMAMFGGAVACVIGAAIWTAVTYYTHYEISWIAWGVGVLAGIGVFAGSGRRGDVALGVLAVLFALAGILLGKFGVVYVSLQEFISSDELHISNIADEVMYERNRNGENWPPISDFAFETAETLEQVYPRQIWAEAEQRWATMSDAERQDVRELPQLANPEYHLVYMADQLVYEYQTEGKALEWPPGMSVDIAFHQEDYPADLWADVVQRWDAMPAGEQETYVASMMAAEKIRNAELQTLMYAEGTTLAFFDSFSLFDGLWAVLAVLSAFKIGSASEETQTA